MRIKHKISMVFSIWLTSVLLILNITVYVLLHKISSHKNMDSIGEMMHIFFSILFLSTIGAVLLLVVGNAVLSKIVLEPIFSMIKAMEEIELSLAFQKIPVVSDSGDELHIMTSTFNRMMARIEESFEKQQQFVSDASHEFRTTLTIIESYARMLKRWGLQDPQIRQEAIEAILLETVRMKQMTSQLLILASTEKEEMLHIQEVDLVKLCEQVARLSRKLENRQIEVLTQDKMMIVAADKMKIKQLLLILLDNALKYSKQEVEIHLYSTRSDRVISVKDYGIGIPEEDIDQVFERFYRVDQARQRKSGGTGLGLSIAKAIVLQHQGEIEITSEEGRGTEIRVYLPISS